MSSNLRGATILFSANTAVTSAGVVSKAGYPGPMVNVGLMIENTGSKSVDVTIQVAGGPPSAGRNPDMSTIKWFDLYDENDGSLVTLSVAAGKSAAFDLSPFAFPYLRIYAVTSGANTTTVNATMVANG